MLLHAGPVGAGIRRVEFHQNLPGLHSVAVLDENPLDDAGLERLEFWDRNAPLPEDADLRRSWGEVYARCRQLASALQRHGVWPPLQRELLERLHIPFDVESPEVDETPHSGESPRALALRLALAKARAVAQRRPQAVVIGSDQVADLHGDPLGKPGTHERAVEQLRRMRVGDISARRRGCDDAAAVALLNLAGGGEDDATKNSISMAAQSMFSHKELHGKDSNAKQAMMLERGRNWNDYPARFKRGSFVQRQKKMMPFSFDELEKLPPKHEARTNPNLQVMRSTYEIIDMPPLGTVTNREAVIFEGDGPIVILPSK